MDLNDPRRRLQVLNNSNPSIRLATAPQKQPTISVSNTPVNQPQITVPQAPQQVQQPVNNNLKGFTMDEGKNKTIFGWNAAALLPKQFEKTYGIKADREINLDHNTFLTQYDKLADDFKNVYTNQIIEQAKSGDAAAQNTLKLLNDTGRTKGNFNDFMTGANDKLYGGISRGILRGTDFLLPGHNTFGLEQLANEQDPSKTGTAQFTTYGKVGEKFGSVEKGIVDLAMLAAGGSAAETAASKVPQFSSLLGKLSSGGKVAQLAGKMVGALPGSLAGSGISSIQTAGKGDKQNFGKDLAIGTAVDLGLPVLGAGFKGLKNIFKSGADDAVSHGLIQDLIDEVDPVKIEKALGVDKEVASYLANETDPQAVKEVLTNLAMDPNLSLPEDVIKRLQDEGVTAVKQDANAAYPAEYNNGVITAQNQAALDANVNHELGHAIWENKLTPEEKALFDGSGEASKQAVGRAGYTQADVNSEDFSDYLNKAFSGRINEVPENVRAVIAKYANIALDQTAPKLLSAVTKSAQDLPNNVGDGFVMADKGASGLKGLVDQMNKVDSKLHDIAQGKVSATREEIDALKSEREALIKKAQEPFSEQLAAVDKANGVESDITKQADEVAKAQTGVADGQVDGSGKMTSQDATGDVSGAGLVNNTELGSSAVKTAENGSSNVLPQTADELVPEGTDPAIKKSVQDFLDNINREGGTLDRAQATFDEAQALRKTEKGARIGKGQSLYDEAGGGEQGFRAKLGALKGKLTDSKYTPISVEPETEKALLDSIEKSKLRPFEKLNTQNALRKVWGANPQAPTAADVNYIRTFFNKNYGEGTGDAFAEGIQKALQEGRDWKDVAAEVAGLPRALMATGDLSGGFRQAMPLGTRFPKLWANANKMSVEWAMNPTKYDAAMKEIADSPAYQLIADKMGVDLTGVGAVQDEAFIAAGLAERIPVANVPIKAADRAYTGVLTKLRYDVANNIIEKAGGIDQFMKNIDEIYGEGDKASKAMRAWGEVINTFTGRGGKKGGLLDSHMRTLSTGLFAPRLWAANIQRLNPAWYIRLAKTNPEAAKLAIQSQGTFLAMAGTVLGLASAAGAQVGMDPRSADFGKIKYGNTRYDILGGQQQNIVQLTRQFTGEKVNSETGEVQTLGDGYGAKNRFDLALDMLENKSNPLLGFGIKLMNTTDNPDSNNPLARVDQYGNDYNVATEGAKLGIPLGIQGSYETSKDVGSAPKGIAMNAPAFFGVGVQTYGTTPTKDQGTDTNGNKTFKGKVTPEMVTDNNGQPMLDEKGKVIKVKFPKDATDMEKQAILKAKQNEAYTSLAKRNMSAEDRAIYKMGEADKTALSSDQQKKYEQLKKYVENYGKKVDIPEGVTADTSKTFYQKWNSMTKDDQEAWLKEAPDENAKTIAQQINAQRSKNLDEYKPSNELAKAYAEYDKDISTHPEYTQVDLRNKAKAFQNFAYKLNFTQDQRDIYAEGGSADLNTLISEKQISKADLDAAIKLDNDLYNSGLTGSLKFSKTFRKQYGYGVPDGGGINKNLSFSGSGGSNDSVNQHLLSYLPSNGSTGQQAGPKFSSKRRTSGITFKDVNAPTKSNNKKVTINL